MTLWNKLVPGTKKMAGPYKRFGFYTLSMRIYTLILFACLLSFYAAKGQGKVSLAFNMNECSNCYNNLRNLDGIDPAVNIEFVFKKQYQSDSADIVRNLYLVKYRASYIWSDSLNEALLFNKIFSSITISNSSQERYFKFSMKNSFSPGLAHYINWLSRPVDTLTLKENVFSSGVKFYIYRDNYVLINDGFKNRISRVNLVDGTTNMVIRMSDSLTKTAFQKKFKDPERWGITQKLIEKYRVANPQKFESITVNSEGIFALAEYAYFLISNKGHDTAKVPFFALHKFSHDGILEQTSLIDQIIDEGSEYAAKFFNNEIKDTILYFYVTSSIAVKDKILSLDMTSYPAMGYKNGKKYFRGNFELQPDGNYKFKNFYDKELPAVYKEYGNNFTNILYSYNSKYFALPLGDVIYKVDAPKKEIHLHVFNGKQFEGLPFQFNYMMNEVNVEKDKAYAFYWLSKEQQSRLLQYDIVSNKPIQDALINTENVSEKFIKHMKMDCFDYNYVIVPVAENKLLRFKVLK